MRVRWPLIGRSEEMTRNGHRPYPSGDRGKTSVLVQETDCPPLDPTPSPSELAIRSRLRWPAWAIAWIAVTAAGMSTGNKMMKKAMAIEKTWVYSAFSAEADRLIFV